MKPALNTYVYEVASSDKAARMVEDIGLPNVFPNLDIGHFVINREAPHRIEKIKGMNISITTTAKNDEECRALLTAFKFPFKLAATKD